MENKPEIIEIIVKKDKLNGEECYRWAWKESVDKKVFGYSKSIADIEESAQRMFPNNTIRLSIL